MAGDNLSALGKVGFPIPHTGESANKVVYILSGEGTKVLSLRDYLAAQGTGTDPASAEVSGTAVTPPSPATRSETAPAAASPIQMAGAEPVEAGMPGGFLSEIRIGVLAHDTGVFGRSKEDGLDFNGELLFASPDFLAIIFSPRPHIGASFNSEGDTNQVYGGLAWDWTFWDPLFVEGTLALAYHDGNTDTASRGRKTLGCEVLFRESVSLGARFLKRHSISVMFSHVSNANLCDDNDGLDNLGLRYGYKF